MKATEKIRVKNKMTSGVVQISQAISLKNQAIITAPHDILEERLTQGIMTVEIGIVQNILIQNPPTEKIVAIIEDIAPLTVGIAKVTEEVQDQVTSMKKALVTTDPHTSQGQHILRRLL